MVGQTLGHYRILEEIGAGGMGVVYRALDTRLDREVAIKILPPGIDAAEISRKRFCTEALALARLNHPNIATVFDFDSQDEIHFLAMEYVAGVTLDRKLAGGPFNEKETIRLGVQLAEGIAAAHAEGVLHRDLKPGNLRVTTQGRLKILDFGVAKLMPSARAQLETRSMTITSKEATPGTLLYMAPEQVLAEEVDFRADVYGIGAVLYEMVTGQPPFPESHYSRLVDAILHRPAAGPRAIRPEISTELERIILKCLEKEPENRYQSTGEIAVDLRRLATGTVAAAAAGAPAKRQPLSAKLGGRYGVAIAAAVLALAALWLFRYIQAQGGNTPRSLAVLPLRSLVADQSTDYLRLAVADEVVTTLAYMPAITVRPFAATAQYADSDAQKAGRELHVSNVITGHYLRDGPQLRITLELIEVKSNRLLWENSVAGSSDNLIAIRQELVGQLRSGLRSVLGISPGVASLPAPTNAEAYGLYLRSAAHPREKEGNQQAIELLERAIQLDPGYASAWHALGVRYSYVAGVGLGKCPCEPTLADTGDSLGRARAAFERALSLDPSLLDSAAALTLFDVDDGQLTAAYDRASQMIQRRPDNAQAHFTLAYVLRYAGLLPEAAKECDTALRLDPGNPELRSCALAFLQLGNYERAKQYVQLDGASEWSARTSVDIALRQGSADVGSRLGKLPKGPAYELLQACLAHRPADEINKLAFVLEMQPASSWDSEPDYFLAAYESFCGRVENAGHILQRAIGRGYCSYPSMDSDPMFVNLRQTPAFQQLRAAGMECQKKFVSHRETRGQPRSVAAGLKTSGSPFR